MNKVKFPLMSMAEAREWCESVDSLSDSDFEALASRWHSYEIDPVGEGFTALRSEIVSEFASAKSVYGLGRDRYGIDVAVGLKTYECLNRLGFTAADAANDDVWRYLTIRVFPDITFQRWPNADKEAREDEGRINRKRFFRHTRRIWLKTLWWYVHLGWQGSANETKDVLKCFTADTISQIVERTGNAYRVDVYRSLLKEISMHPSLKGSDAKKLAQINRSECCVVEPALTLGGVDGYCRSLVASYLGSKER